MALNTTTNRVSYAGNDVTTAFSFPYYFLADGDLTVTLVSSLGVETIKTITTHYTVSGAGNEAGGTVTMLTAPATGETLVIFRDPDVTQGVDLVENDAMPAEVVEEALDKLTMIAQRANELIARSIRLPDGFTDSFDTKLPADFNSAGAFIQVNGAATGFTAIDALTDSEVALPLGTGIMSRTGTTTAALRTVTGTASEIDLSNGDGVSGNPTVGIADDPIIPGTGKIRLPAGTTAQRPGSPANADARYNSTTGLFEFYQNGAWTNYRNFTNLNTYRAATTTDTVLTTDETLKYSGSSFTATLPTAVGVAGKRYKFLHLGTSLTQVYTFATTGGQTIGGIASGSLAMYTNGEVFEFESDGANWLIVRHNSGTEWTSAGTLTISATTSAPTKGSVQDFDIVRWRRIGDSANIRVSFRQSNATGSAAGTGDYLFGMPSNMSIDTAKVTAYTTVEGWNSAYTNAFTVGRATAGDGVSTFDGQVCVYDASYVRLVGINSTPDAGFIGALGYPLTGANIFYSLDYIVPISGWRA